MRPLAPLAALAALLLVVTAPGAAHAQGDVPTPPAPRLPRLGIMLGLNSASISDVEGLDTERRNGFDGGLYVSFPVGRTLSIQPELLFAQRGTKANVDVGEIDPSLPIGNVEASLNLNYIEVPFLLRLDIPTTSSIRPHLYLGPTFAFNMSCDFSASALGQSTTVDCNDSEIGLQPKGFDAGAMLGGGLAFDVAGGRRLSIGLRYTFGLTNVFENTGDGTEPKHRILAIYGAFDMPLGGR